MKLAIDIGNTSITCGLFEDESTINRFRINEINQLHNHIGNDLSKKVNKIVISSVVPDLTKEYVSYLKSKNINKIRLIDYKTTNLVLKVTHPETVGNDRLCNMFAALKLYNCPAIIVDFGTATTYDVINVNHEFIGGAIGAGIKTSADYLINNAALLSKTDLQVPDKVIGIDTKENIQSGIMFGAIDQVEGMIKRIKKECDDKYTLILTGGFSKLLSPHLTMNHILDMNLTLKGMYYIDELNND